MFTLYLQIIPEKLKSVHRNVAIQGELLGPKIQDNKYKLKEHTIKFFNAYDIDNHQYLDYKYFEEIICVLELDLVPVIDLGFTLNHTVDELVEFTKGKSVLFPIEREGLVFRPIKEDNDLELGRLSFKIINPQFLLDNKE